MQISKRESSRGVSVVVSEPWDIVSELSSPKISGLVVAKNSKAMIIDLGDAVAVKDDKFRYFLVLPRHAEDSFDSASGSTFCNLTSLRETEANEGIPPEPSKLKGDVMLIGDVTWS